jgi:hypothetical protein
VIQLPDLQLPAAAQNSLVHWQSEVDALAHYAKRVEAAQRLFKQRNTQRNKTFATVRRTLTQMCSGAQRCGYCEDSAADEVEHILRLNAREYLPVARADAYGSYKARLSEYLSLRSQGARKPQLDRCIHGIQRGTHPTVWKEMQRQRTLHLELRELFREAPEALNW